MNDDTEGTSIYCVTHVVSKHLKVLPVFLGASQTMIKGLIGVYVSDRDYRFIRHDKAYIFIHDPDAVDGDIAHINWDDIKDDITGRLVGREHMHIWK